MRNLQPASSMVVHPGIGVPRPRRLYARSRVALGVGIATLVATAAQATVCNNQFPTITVGLSNSTSGKLSNYTIDTTVPNVNGCEVLASSTTVTINFPADTDVSTVTTGTLNGSVISFTTKTGQMVQFHSPLKVVFNKPFTVILNGVTNPTAGGNVTLSLAASPTYSGSLLTTTSGSYAIVAPTPTPTNTPTITPTVTQTPTNTPILSFTPTQTPTSTPGGLCLGSSPTNPCIPSGGTRFGCGFELVTNPVPPLRLTGFPTNRLSCSEGNPTCDFDPNPNNKSCTFHVTMCINNTDPRLPACTPKDLFSFAVTQPNPLHPRDAADTANAQTLEMQAGGGAGGFGVNVLRGNTVVFSGSANPTPNSCSNPMNIVVPLRQLTTGKTIAGSKTIQVRAGNSLNRRYVDTLLLQCKPGVPMSPTITPTSGGATATPTNTPVATGTPTDTPPAASSSTPTNTPLATNTPTQTFTPAPAVCGGISVPASSCCNHQIDAGEQCDDGGNCVGGANDSIACTNNTGCPGGECRAFGGDGCAANCTFETSITYTFTGAVCQGGANAGQDCHFKRTCVGGAFPTKPCATNTDCGPSGNRGTCTSECGLTGLLPTGAPTNDGSDCAGLGSCSGGTTPGASCPSAADKNVPPAPLLICDNNSGAKKGIICTVNSNCTPGLCINPCGTGGTCVHKSGAVLTSLGIVGTLGIGPLSGGQDLVIGGADANGVIPVAVPANSVHFDPVTVPLLACACPRGLAVPDVDGPGNAGSGFIGCGASGLPTSNVDQSQDHNSTPPHTCIGGPSPGAACTTDNDCGGTGVGTCNVTNGPGTCSAGPRSGLACSSYTLPCTGGTCSATTGRCVGGANNGLACTDCPGPGGTTCTGVGGGGGVCVGGTNNMHVCHADSDCGANAYCDSPDDPTCTLSAVPPRTDVNATACLEQNTVCTSGPKIGQPCATAFDCSGGAPNIFCGTACNLLSPHPGVCNSPAHIFLSTPGPQGSGLIVTTTAIGVISAIGDTRPCRRSAVCSNFAFNSTLTACEVDSQCTNPSTCISAYCAGICTAGVNTGKPCIKVSPSNDCGSGGVCTPGAQFAQDCSANPMSACGGDGICVAVNPDKGFDGLPCTDDDPQSSRGNPSTIPTTTGIATAGMVDANNGGDGNVPGNLMINGLCSGVTTCTTSKQGALFNCNALTNSHSVSGAALVSAFTQIDGNQTEDTVVTNGQAAK